jgi:hypothetical protein
LHYSLLAGAPTGAGIDPGTGLFTWTPDESQGPSQYTLTVQVTDSGLPPLTTQREFILNVTEVNLGPQLAALPDRLVGQDQLLTFAVEFSDDDLPANNLTFTLEGAPAGATIGSASGFFQWTPSQSMTPGNYSIGVRVTDNGSPGQSAIQEFSVHVFDTNAVPQLVLGNIQVRPGDLLSLTGYAQDADVPAQQLSYSLASGAPAGLSIDVVTGKISWPISWQQQPGSFSVTVQVADDGSPSQVTAAMFDIEVLAVLRPWSNPRHALDVDDDKFIAPADALTVINYINSFGSVALISPTDERHPAPYLDVVADGFVAPDDALTVINYINSFGSGPVGEPISSSVENGSSVSEKCPMSSDGGLTEDELITLMALDQASQQKKLR